MVVLGCSDSGSTSSAETKKYPVPPGYIGTWTGQDGSTVTFRNDGSGDYKSGGKSVSGGSVQIDEAAKEIRFSFMGFDSGKYKIDQPPKGNKMQLDGMEYRRTGGFSTEDSKLVTDAPPSEEEIRPTATETMQDFDRAIEKGDFTDFYANISETWQSQTTVSQLNESFASVMRKSDYRIKTDVPLAFLSKSAFGKDNVLEVNGSYQNLKGKSVSFRLRYVQETGDWKLLGIRLNP